MGATASSNTIKNNIISNTYQGEPITPNSSYTQPVWCPAGVDSGFSKTHGQAIKTKTESGLAENKSDIHTQINPDGNVDLTTNPGGNVDLTTNPGGTVDLTTNPDGNVDLTNPGGNVGKKQNNVFASNTMSTILLVVAALVIIAAVIGIISYFIKNKNISSSNTTAKNNFNANGTTDIRNNKSLLVLIVLIVLLLIAVAFNSTQKKTPISEKDLEHLKQTISDAQEIANINPSIPSTPDNNYSPSDEVVGNNIYYSMQYDENECDFDTTPLEDFYKPLLQQK